MNADIRKRGTKIICTLGKKTKDKEAIKHMIEKGMDVARLNMNYFSVNEQDEIVNNVKQAAKELGKDVAIMVDLKGPFIRTTKFSKDLYSIKVKAGQEIRVSSSGLIEGN